MQPVKPCVFPAGHLEERLWVKLHTTAGLICRVFSPKGEAQYLFLPPFRLHGPTFTLRWLSCIFIRVLQLIKNVHFYLPYWYFPLHSNNSLNTGSEECSKSPKLGQKHTSQCRGQTGGGKTGKVTSRQIDSSQIISFYSRAGQEIMSSLIACRLETRTPSATGNLLSV